VRVREASEGDLPGLRALLRHYVDEFWRPPAQPPTISNSWFHEQKVFFAEENGQATGIAIVSLRESNGRVSLVYVLPEARQQGVARALLEDVVAFFGKEHVQHVTLGVDPSNTAALAYWQRLGFVEYQRELIVDLPTLEDRVDPH